MTNSWSYSYYSTAQRCLALYKAIVIDKVVHYKHDDGDLEFGSALHAAINASLQGGSAAEVFSLYWESLKTKNIQYGRYKWEDCKNLGFDFSRKFDKTYKDKFIPKYMEQRMYADYKGLKFEGTADYIGLYLNKPSVFDWKTSGYNYDERKIENAIQMNLYAFLVYSELQYVPEQLGYLVFNKGTGSIQKPIVTEFSFKKMYSMLDDMLDYCESIDKKQTYPRNPGNCIIGTKVCPMFSKCWKEPYE